MMGRQTEQSQSFSSPISRKLANEFFEALREYIRWSFGSPERGDVYRYLVRIALVCGRVDGYADPLPDDVFDVVKFLLTDRQLKEELRAHRTYDTAARCFLAVIKDKERSYSENERGHEQKQAPLPEHAGS
jgi:hypothetical protein